MTINMQSRTRTKYLLKLILNHNENRHLIKMMATYLGAKPLSSRRSLTFRSLKKLFIDYTGLNAREVKSLLRDHAAIPELPINHLARYLGLCRDFGIDMRSVRSNIGFLYLSEDELECRITILKEMGAKYITTAMIHSMAHITPAVLFKAYARIPENECIAENIYSCLYKLPPATPLLGALNESMTVYTYRQRCLKHYLRWRFQACKHNEKMLDKLTCRLMYKPLSKIDHAFHVLHKHTGMSRETIWKYQCLVRCSGSDLMRILKDIKTVCDVSILDLLNISPALHAMRYKDVSLIKTYLEKYNITGEQIKNCPTILLREKKDFMEGWRILMETPKLRILMTHPKFLRIFGLRENFYDRLRYLDYVNVHAATIDVLTADAPRFERFIRVGAFRNRAKEMSVILSSYMELDSAQIEQKLMRHPHWHHGSLLNMYETLCYLKKQFYDVDIACNLHVILYPKDKVQNVSEKLCHENELMEPSDRFTPSQILALCVYEIEKKFHFTGDGIWDNIDQNKLPSKPEGFDHDTAESK